MRKITDKEVKFFVYDTEITISKLMFNAFKAANCKYKNLSKRGKNYFSSLYLDYLKDKIQPEWILNHLRGKIQRGELK